MPCPFDTLLRRSRAPLAALLCCGMLGCAQVAQVAQVAQSPSPPRLASTPTLEALAQGDALLLPAAAFDQGVVSAANPYAAEAGARMLEKGGNAVDAAVAIAYALNVVEPQSAGIGGGGFMLIHLANGHRTVAIDSREKAPAGATPGMFDGIGNASLQGVAVGVPGMVRGTALALESYGRLSLGEVLQPAIELAEAGFLATPRYAALSCNARSRNSPQAEAFFCPGPGNSGPVVGSLVRNAPLARTLRLIATHGPDCFYLDMPEKGCDIARGIVEGQQFSKPTEVDGVNLPGRGGSMTLADLAAYRPALRQPIEGSYRGYKIVSMAPPSSGALTMLQMMKMLERFPIGDSGQSYGFGALKTVNVMAEAMRVAFADRSVWMGDDDFSPAPAKGLLNPGYLSLRGSMIVPGARMAADPRPGNPLPYQTAGAAAQPALADAEPRTVGPGETTTHFSVADRHGNLVAYTNTIESSHGIGVFAGYRKPDGTLQHHGFLLNNELTDFNAGVTQNPFTGGPGHNDVQPGKRPRSSMTPTIIFSPDGKPLVAFGSPGGATIINSVFNVALNLIDHRMPIQDAINAPRFSLTSARSELSLEPGFREATRAGLLALGYTLRDTSDIGSVQAVLLDPKTGRQYGAADPRREGTVIGLPRQTHERR